MAIFAVIRRSPRRWWLWANLVVSAFIMVGAVIAPVFISPLFNTYKPMAAGPLRDQILGMAHANHIPAENVYVFDASKQTKRISANVSGLGPTIRISLNDNLLNRTSPAEVKAVMGHEMGHYVLGHVWRNLIAFTAVFLLLFALLWWSAPRMLARYGQRWGVTKVEDPASLPLLMAIASVLFLVLTPVLNTIVRTDEAEADAFGLDAAQEPDGFAAVSMKLSEYRKISPGPVEEFIFFDPPSGENRVRRAMQWKAKHLNEAP
jgi:STE24 endopeptidase